MHHTAENAYMGLAAMYLMSDELEDSLPIPKGNYDLPVVISDKMFAANGSLMYDDEGHSGLYGDVMLVNGQPWPNLKVEPRKYRFRILNASLSRGLRLQLSNTAVPMTVIATDGGLMPKPQTTAQLRVGMAERYEVVIDFAKIPVGTKIQLRNLGVPNSRDFDHTDKVMQFEVIGEHAGTWRTTQVPAELNPQNEIMLLDETKFPGIKTVKLELHRSNSTWKVNNTTWDDIVKSNYQTVVANPEPDEVQIWEITNKLRRLVPPDPHPPGRLQDPLAERQGAVQLRAGPEGRRVRRRERERPADHEVHPPDRPLHDPLPQPAARGPRHDDAVPRGHRHGGQRPHDVRPGEGVPGVSRVRVTGRGRGGRPRPVGCRASGRAPVRSAPMPAATTNPIPATAATPGTWCSTTRPMTSATAGSRLIRVPNAAAVSRRRASSSRLNGTTGSSTASPRPTSTSSGVTCPSTDGPTTSVATSAATGIETARPRRPATSSPTRCVSTM